MKMVTLRRSEGIKNNEKLEEWTSSLGHSSFRGTSIQDTLRETSIRDTLLETSIRDTLRDTIFSTDGNALQLKLFQRSTPLSCNPKRAQSPGVALSIMAYGEVSPAKFIHDPTINI